jgi:hypothetical protein
MDNQSPPNLVGKRQISQASLEVDEDKRTEMPFSGNCHSFDFSTLKALTNAGAVYGLFNSLLKNTVSLQL